ncbi:hypothetical protein CDEST_00577 [Colletotrichum destructivum]|uniref:Uncharacterized protein n=1 Tax=Colletotrichum destructivum TaxID=34406 RepID=A0AAX4HXT6_9PEZI|nr:hypothetical protein CDEST_00577 [Colletotrichum destructivum]
MSNTHLPSPVSAASCKQARSSVARSVSRRLACRATPARAFPSAPARGSVSRTLASM